MPHFTMCHDALMTAWWQIGVGYTTKLNVSTITDLKFVIDSAFCTVNIDFLIKLSQEVLTSSCNSLMYKE